MSNKQTYRHYISNEKNINGYWGYYYEFKTFKVYWAYRLYEKEIIIRTQINNLKECYKDNTLIKYHLNASSNINDVDLKIKHLTEDLRKLTLNPL